MTIPLTPLSASSMYARKDSLLFSHFWGSAEPGGLYASESSMVTSLPPFHQYIQSCLPPKIEYHAQPFVIPFGHPPFIRSGFGVA